MEVWETRINEYLKGEGISPIKIVNDNKIYPKTKIHNPTDAQVLLKSKVCGLMMKVNLFYFYG